MVSPEPGAPTPAVGAHSYKISPDLLPASIHPASNRHALIDSRLLVPPIPDERDLPVHWTARFFTPLSLGIVAYCIAMVAFADYARAFMRMHIGPINGSCAFAFSQLLIAWIVAALYVRAAGIFASIPQPAPSEARSR